MGSIYPRGQKLSVRYKNAQGKWIAQATSFVVGQEKQAQAMLAEVERRMGEDAADATTVRGYAKRWLADRKRRDLGDVQKTDTRFEKYVFPSIGGCRFGEAAALRWSAYEPDKKPLGRLHVAYSYDSERQRVKSTKCEVPVHPVLAQLLGEWHATGWESFVGHAPGNDDLALPSTVGGPP